MAFAFQNQYFSVEVNHDERCVEVVRTELPFQVLQDFVATLDDLLRGVKEAGGQNYCLLYDSRRAPAATGKTYTKAFFRMAEQLSQRFDPVAVILATPEAIEQVLPYASEHVHFFTNPVGARNAIRQMMASRPQRTMASAGTAGRVG